MVSQILTTIMINVKCAIEAPHDYLFNLTKKPRLEIAITKKECMLLTCTCI